MPLTDDQIESTFANLFREAHTAFLGDPDYVCRMAEEAARLKTRNGNRAAARAKYNVKPKPEPAPEPPKPPKPEPEPDPTKLRNDKIRALRAGGLTLAEIAEQVQLTVSGVRAVLREPAGVRVRSKKWAERDAYVADALARGLQQKDIARDLGISKASVSLLVKRLRADTH